MAKLDANNLLIGHWRDMAATQAKLRLEIENHLWANDLSNIGYPESGIANKVQAVFAHLYSSASDDGRLILH